MTHKLTVRFGGAADSEVHDYSDRVRYVDGSGPAILGGMQADNGSPGMGQFILDDVDNDIPHRTDPPGLQLAAHNQLIWSEDSPGYDAWLSIGRIDNKNVGRPYTYTAGVNRQWTGQWADANFDLDGITLTTDEARPAETDVDRVLWALATFCAGNYRLTTDFGTHLVASSPVFTMEAKTYPAGTELLEILDDCAQLAGKRYAVVIHEDSGADHACFEYIDEEDHTTYVCTLSISDQLDEVDGETVFEPVWRQGAATTEDGQELITGVVSRYGADTSATVFAEDTDHADAYDRWIKPYNDDLSVSAAQATARATAIVHSRWNEHVSHQPSILIPARLHNLIRAGMSIDIKSAAAMGGQYLNTVQTRRIAAIEWGAAGWRGSDAMLWANLKLDRTPRQLPLSNGKAQPAATTPKPPTSTTVGAPDVVSGWPSGAGGVVADASAIIDGDLLSGDGTGYYIARIRGGGGAVFMGWTDPVVLTSYTMHQGFSPEDAQYASSGSARAGWRLYGSNDAITLDPADVSWTELENAESSASLNDSTHAISVGAWRWWAWWSTVQDTPGALQIDWVIREIDFEGGTSGAPPPAVEFGTPPSEGTSPDYSRSDATEGTPPLGGVSRVPIDSANPPDVGDILTVTAADSPTTAVAAWKPNIAASVTVADTAGNFTGTDVEAVLAELQDNIDASAGATALDDLSDVTITAAAVGDMARYDGSAWVNTPGRWEPVTTNPGTGPELVWDGDEIVMTWSAT